MRPAVIIGGGISGLSAAYQLVRSGAACALIERRERLGGVIRSEFIQGCVVETGPDSWLAEKPWAFELARELGLDGEVIGSNDHLRVTYVLKQGRLVPLPDGLMMMVPTRIWPVLTSPLLSWRTKARMAGEWFRRPRSASGDRSVAEFVAQHYGQEAVDYLAEPLLAGVYGGDPSQLSVASVLPRFVELERHYGSLTRGVLAVRRRAARESKGPLFQTLRGGMQRLVEALVGAISGHAEIFRAEADTVEKLPGGYRVRAGGHWLEARNVVLACPAWEAARLLRALDGELAALLDAIPYTSSITVSLGYRSQDMGRRLRGFGFLVPRCERRRLVACTWVETKFSHRVAAGMALIRCFLGDEELLDAPEREIEELVREELARIMGLRAEPMFTRVARWPCSMAQYTVGHGERLATARARLARWPGLLLAGNAYEGIGVPDCVRMGRRAAEQILARLG
ncbi:MAG: protoporphyrinogen oxidase [Bryobacteraceae bacterium]